MVKTSPDPSLCDTCKNAYLVEGGGASMSGIGNESGYNCSQRYCSVLTVAIHFGGKQECNKYKRKE